MYWKRAGIRMKGPGPARANRKERFKGRFYGLILPYGRRRDFAKGFFHFLCCNSAIPPKSALLIAFIYC